MDSDCTENEADNDGKKDHQNNTLTKATGEFAEPANKRLLNMQSHSLYFWEWCSDFIVAQHY